ncbi:hypothetical protein NCU06134 [Neurospora crassa OR74A]|uniref:Uncharacterized protein n=1 Tax=Neurospora crassa (strain ATCC 24698 / 74-OR23-1A / CBS 708.71 / DSM 1257 / FGSC 987) TaxID=367110 RepID=Q7S5F4_NEUCR|nr:hypothetical protein NCU06134 [Neurospora crassa OR74A]EAA30760.1 hypothetical protein NCU06134 [Neurospora crassa OR74A]|eukprot:XP_959996.1 hypothetical protein NCU06134 [Neurospora crassa OR74A]
MGSITYFTDSPPSPPPPGHVLTALNNVSTRGYHCRALLLPWPHSLCAAILEPALIRTLLPDFSFLASCQLGPASAASSTISDHNAIDTPDPDPYTNASRPPHHSSNPNTNRNFALQRLSSLTQGDMVYLYFEGGRDPSHLLRPGPNPLVRLPEERYNPDGDDEDAYTAAAAAAHRLMQLYHRFPIQQTPEDAVRQLITHHEEHRLEMSFEELLIQGPYYPFRVPDICFRIPLPLDGRMDFSSRHGPPPPPRHSRLILDAMTVQRSRLLGGGGGEFSSSSSSSDTTGMVLGIAIHQAVADAADVEVIMSRLRRELLREVVVGFEHE